MLVLAFFLIATAAHGQDADVDQPHWTFEMKAGRFMPDLPEWNRFHNRKYMPEYAASVAYKLIRQIEAGVEAGYLTTKGIAFAPQHNLLTGSVTYTLYPVNAFVLFRGIIRESQWLVPYAGGGYTKMFYRETVEDQSAIKGSVNGYHARAGIQILLDGLDPGGANNLTMEYGILHSYLFIEARYSRAVVSSINLGGTSYLSGLMFEF
jgi:hypothetical protein